MTGYQIPWVFTNERTSSVFTSSVMSAQVNIGRQSYMNVYNGGSLSITIKNQSNEAAAFQMNDIVTLSVASSYGVSFWVDEIQFNDYPGNTGLSTATIICSDGIARLGRSLVTNLSLSQLPCAQQAEQLTPSGVPKVVEVINTGPSSTASAATYSGAPMTRINQLISTERGVLRNQFKDIRFFSRGSFGLLSYIDVGRTTSSSAIGYQDFSRIALGMNFMNTVTVTPTGLSEQIASNAASVAAYGSNFYSVQSEDFTNAQGLGLAEWLSNSQSDPTALRFEFGFTDRAQFSAAVNSFFGALLFQGVNFTYRVPGAASDTTVKTLVEGYSVSITPSESSWRVYLSPLTYYQFFTLNDATLGVLDTSRLGW